MFLGIYVLCLINCNVIRRQRELILRRMNSFNELVLQYYEIIEVFDEFKFNEIRQREFYLSSLI